jgi:galactose mutarotase-like enzyme
MGIITIENQNLKVEIKSKGAELSSLLDKADGLEHMWRADSKYWPRHAPILFPCVGESKDGKVSINGIDYPMGRHGFARQEEFTLTESDVGHATFKLKANASTRKHYPFDFALKVSYRLDGKSLKQEFQVLNLGKTVLGFQLGGHPAFAVPFGNKGSYNDYEIHFNRTLNLERHLLTDGGLYSGETRQVLNDENKFELSYELFSEDALVFKEIDSKQVWIQHKNGGKKLVMDYEGFPHLGIWSVQGADYVCLEPWIGCADKANQPADYFQKDGIMKLQANERFSVSFSISLA